MLNLKEKVYIDVFLTEDGYEIYFLGSHKEDGKGRIQADVCDSSGFFYDEDNLNSFLEENEDEIEIVEDYRF